MVEGILVAEVVFDGLAKALLFFEEGEETADEALQEGGVHGLVDAQGGAGQGLEVVRGKGEFAATRGGS